MGQVMRAYAIGYCGTCSETQNAERFITTNETQWLNAAAACRECAAYEVTIEVENA